MPRRVLARPALAIALLATASHAQLTDFIDAGRGPIPLRVPTTYSPEEPLPLIIALHGFQQDGPEVEAYFNITPLVESRGFLYIAPSGRRNFLGLGYWNALAACCDLFNNNPDDSGYLRALIELIQSEYSVDPRRIHIVGYSNGGFMAYRMACDHSDLIASIVSLAGAMPDDSDPPCAAHNPVSVLQIHGTADSVINYFGGTIALGGDYPSALDSTRAWAAFNGCDLTPEPNGPLFDLAASVPGAESMSEVFRTNCATGYEAELWTMMDTDHGPPFIADPVEPTNIFATSSVDWLLAHPKPSNCPADLTGSSDPNDLSYGMPDGDSDGDDLFYYLDNFSTGYTAVCDLTGSSDPNDPSFGTPDGDCVGDDSFYYLDLFAAGCP
ncbi:MAG: GC-type dockerin domain-anchored protein [Phycisphaerales bacterium JB037]